MTLPNVGGDARFLDSVNPLNPIGKRAPMATL
jgi:hypothetical protein